MDASLELLERIADFQKLSHGRCFAFHSWKLVNFVFLAGHQYETAGYPPRAIVTISRSLRSE